MDKTYISRKLRMEVKSAISKIKNILSSRKLTEDVAKRKRLKLKISFTNISQWNLSYLNLSKHHLLNNKQRELFKEIVVCFCKPEKFVSLNGKGLVSLRKLASDIIVEKKELFFLGGLQCTLISKESRFCQWKLKSCFWILFENYNI